MTTSDPQKLSSEELRELIKENYGLHDKTCGVRLTHDLGNCDCDKNELWELIQSYASQCRKEGALAAREVLNRECGIESNATPEYLIDRYADLEKQYKEEV